MNKLIALRIINSHEDYSPDVDHWLKIAAQASYQGDKFQHYMKLVTSGHATLFAVNGAANGIVLMQVNGTGAGRQAEVLAMAGDNMMKFALEIQRELLEWGRKFEIRLFSAYTEDKRLSHWMEKRAHMKPIGTVHVLEVLNG